MLKCFFFYKLKLYSIVYRIISFNRTLSINFAYDFQLFNWFHFLNPLLIATIYTPEKTVFIVRGYYKKNKSTGSVPFFIGVFENGDAM